MNLCYRTYPDADIIETWTEITHEEKKAITLNRFASAYLPIRKGDVWVSHLYGSWANEAQLAQEPLRPGIKMIKNKDGIRNSHTAHAEVMISLDGKPKENTGSVIGAALCYSGNYKLFFDTDDSDYHHFFAGINEENSAYTLKAKESFRTPELALTYSKDGLSGSSRNFHAWARKHKIANGATARKILLNSWEGVYFDINQEGMDQMMSDIQSMGGELFVMDDGWFGDKYPRNKDNSSLGDWMVDARKLPRGIEGLIADANKQIENTIRTIREAQAEKELTRLARRELDDFRDAVAKADTADKDAEVAREIERIERRRQRREERKAQRGEAQAAGAAPAEAPKPREVEAGSKVRMAGQDMVGVVQSVKGRKAQVAFGQILTTVDRKMLTVVSNSEFREATRPQTARTVVSADISARKLSFKDHIDVRGMRAAEALDAVQDFIDDALMVGVGSVSILHGKGTGALKEEIRRYLRTVPEVESARDEHADRGGAGITIVTFDLS